MSNHEINRREYELDGKSATFITNILKSINCEGVENVGVVNGIHGSHDRSSVDSARRKTFLDFLVRCLEWSTVNDVEQAIFAARGKSGFGNEEDDGVLRIESFGGGSVLADRNVDGFVDVDKIQ